MKSLETPVLQYLNATYSNMASGIPLVGSQQGLIKPLLECTDSVLEQKGIVNC